MMTAKLFTNGRSQAIRLPKEFRFEGNEVGIKKIGDMVLLMPVNETWSSLIESLDMFSDDFMVFERNEEKQTREDL